MLIVLIVLAAAAPAAAEVRTIAQVQTPARASGRVAVPVVEAFRGRVVWSDYDAATDSWRLMEHAADVTQPVPVPRRSSPFDVDLGPDGHAGRLPRNWLIIRPPR